MATIIKSDGAEVSLLAVSLASLQAGVDGYIELIRLEDGRHLYVNEEGLLRKLPLNRKASVLAGRHIMGDAVVLTLAESIKEEIQVVEATKAKNEKGEKIYEVSCDRHEFFALLAAKDEKEALEKAFTILQEGSLGKDVRLLYKHRDDKELSEDEATFIMNQFILVMRTYNLMAVRVDIESRNMWTKHPDGTAIEGEKRESLIADLARLMAHHALLGIDIDITNILLKEST